MNGQPRGVTAVIELAATVLLALAAVSTAWCGYQATRWNGEQAKASAGASAARFRAEFAPAVDAWLATRPLTDPDAPPTPFAMPEYDLAASTSAARLDKQAEALAAKVRVDLPRASNYVLGVVLCSVALFLAA